jgi:hypothetical protein
MPTNCHANRHSTTSSSCFSSSAPLAFGKVMRRALLAFALLSHACSIAAFISQVRMSAYVAQSKPVKTWKLIDAAAAAQSFQPAPFNAVWWGRNSHAHTIIGSGEVSKRIFRKEGPKVVFRRERFDTPDADFIHVDFLDPISSSTTASGVSKIAVLTHGLESSSEAPLTSKMALAFARRSVQH